MIITQIAFRISFSRVQQSISAKYIIFKTFLENLFERYTIRVNNNTFLTIRSAETDSIYLFKCVHICEYAE